MASTRRVRFRDIQSNGSYIQRRPLQPKDEQSAQKIFMDMALHSAHPDQDLAT
ncbi:MAG: hypothetical protein ACKO5Q_08600 [Microcystaceae cyanobacterium]